MDKLWFLLLTNNAATLKPQIQMTLHQISMMFSHLTQNMTWHNVFMLLVSACEIHLAKSHQKQTTNNSLHFLTSITKQC